MPKKWRGRAAQGDRTPREQAFEVRDDDVDHGEIARHHIMQEKSAIRTEVQRVEVVRECKTIPDR